MTAVIVTGAAGGIGTAVCERLRQDGYLVIGIDRVPSPAADVDRPFDLAETGGLQDCESRRPFTSVATIPRSSLASVITSRSA